MPDAELSGERLAREVERLLAQPERLESMSKASYALGPREATAHIAEALVRLAGGERTGEADVRAS